MFNKIINVINEYKALKSIEEASDTSVSQEDNLEKLNIISNQLLSFDIVIKMSGYIDLLIEKEAYLVEVSVNQKKKHRLNNVIIPLLIGISSAILGGIVVSIVSNLLFK